MEIHFQKNYNVMRLQQWLDYELSTVILFLLTYLWGLALLLVLVAAVLFTPFMLKILFEEKRFGWIIAFVITVLTPAIVFIFFEIETSYKFALQLIPLGLFYFFCFVLRLAIKFW